MTPERMAEFKAAAQADDLPVWEYQACISECLDEIELQQKAWEAKAVQVAEEMAECYRLIDQVKALQAENADLRRRGGGEAMTHTWYWRKRLPERKGEPCRLLATGRMNSVLIGFADGTLVVASRWAIRRLKQP